MCKRHPLLIGLLVKMVYTKETSPTLISLFNNDLESEISQLNVGIQIGDKNWLFVICGRHCHS